MLHYATIYPETLQLLKQLQKIEFLSKKKIFYIKKNINGVSYKRVENF